MTSKSTPRYQSTLPVVMAIALGVFTLTAARAFAQTEPGSSIEPVLDLAAPFSGGNPGLRGANPTVGLGSAGDVIGTLQLAGDGVTTANDFAFFHTAPGGVPRIVIREGDPIDPAGHPEAQWLEAEDFYVDRFGTIAILARVTDPVIGWTRALLRGTADHLQVVAMDAELGEGWGIGLSGLQLSSPGRLAFLGVTAEGSRLWFDELATGSVQLDTNTPIAMPPGAVLAAVYSPFLLNNFDDLLFRGLAQNAPGGGTVENLDGVWVKNNLGVQALLLNNSPSPVFPDTTVGLAFNRDYLLFSDSGWAVVKVRHTGSPDGVRDGTAIYVGAPGQMHLVVDEGTEPFGLDGAIFTSDFRLQGMSELGDVFFRNRIRLASGATPDSHWRWSGGVLHLVAMEGQSAPGDPDQSLDGLETDGIISASGQVIIRSRVGTSFLVSALLIESPGQPLRWLLGTGDPVPGPNGTPASVDSASLIVPKSGARFDDRGRFLARILDVNLRESLVWVDPAALLPPSPGTIAGTILDDTDGSGGFSAADSGLAGARVELFHADASGQPAGGALAFVVTDPTGAYTFPELPAGEYVVVEINPPGYASVTDSRGANDDRIWLTLAEGESGSGFDFLDRLPPLQTITITLHRVEPDAVVNLEAGKQAIDQPLLPVADPDRLGKLPQVSHGLVADGVTPLILRVGFVPGELRVSRPIRFRIAEVEGGQVAGGLGDHWRRLHEDWTNSADDQIVDAEHPEAYALLTAIPMHQLEFAPGSVELAVSVSVEDVLTGGLLQNRTVYLRRPPIALIHGYNTDGDWGTEFREVLNGSRTWEESDPPDNFVRTIRYGQFKPYTAATKRVWVLDWLTNGRYDLAGNILNHENTLLRLDELVPKLHTDLEEQMAPLRSHWAFTRHDVIAHSQGGLLTRMLASNRGRTGSHPPFRSVNNFYRGRFHRAITVGSPHNGSRLLGYILRLGESSAGPLSTVAIPRLLASLSIYAGKAQDKFDPFGGQIRALNDPSPANPWTPDPGARFHLVRTTIARGRAPDASDTTPIAIALGLDRPAGAQVLPRGSDGIVDFDSMVCGSPGEPPPYNSHTISPEVIISHSGPTPLFTERGGIEAIGQTSSPDVALHAREMLDATFASAFGPFPVPAPLDASVDVGLYDAANPGFFADLAMDWSRPLLNAIHQEASVRRSLAGVGLAGGPTTVYTYHLEAPSRAPGSKVAWFAEVFGPDGVSSDAVEIVPVSDEPPTVDLEVPDSILGDVVLYSYCTLLDGRGVWMRPENVVSRLPEGATPSEIAVISPVGTYPLGERLSPRILVRYSDGTVLLRHVMADVLTAVSSAPDVVDVSDPLLWTMGQPGQAEVTVSFFGLTATSELTVRPEQPVVEGLRILSWAHGDGTFEVTMPVWDDADLILWRSHTLTGGSWAPVPNAVVTRPAPETAVLEDSSPPDQPTFYRVEVIRP